MTEKRLSKREELYVAARLEGANKTQAAIKAGYGAKNAHKEGWKLERKPHVLAAIQAVSRRALEQAGVTRERVVAELAAIGFADIRKAVRWGNVAQVTGETADGEPIMTHANDVALIDSDKLDAETAVAIAEVKRGQDGTISIKMHSKLQALQEIVKVMGYADEGHNPPPAPPPAPEVHNHNHLHLQIREERRTALMEIFGDALAITGTPAVDKTGGD